MDADFMQEGDVSAIIFILKGNDSSEYNNQDSSLSVGKVHYYNVW
jgi:hypothetical protein